MKSELLRSLEKSLKHLREEDLIDFLRKLDDNQQRALLYFLQIMPGKEPEKIQEDEK